MIVSFVLGSFNRYHYLKATIHSIRSEIQQFNLKSEIIVIDGGSTDGSTKWLAKQKDVILILQHNRGEWLGKTIERKSWGYFMNLGFKAAKGKYICMLSDDCLIIPGAVNNGIAEFESQLNKGIKLGALAFYWRNWPVEKEYKVCLLSGDKPTVNHGLYLNSVLKEVGFVDEKNYFFYYADGDIIMRMYENGFVSAVCENSFVEHHAHANQIVRNSNSLKEQADLEYYLKRWKINNTEAMGKWQTVSHIDKHQIINMFPKTIYSRLKNILRKQLGK